jgi:hypothetical protein
MDGRCVACAACGAGPADARLGPAGSEYWPEQRAELTCDACAERLTLAAERFRRAKGWSALQERLAYSWPGGQMAMPALTRTDYQQKEP